MTDTRGTFNFVADTPRDAAGLQVAPLIDIVFLLICFYLLVAQLTTEQKDASVELPAMAKAALAVERPAEIVINLRRDGGVVVGGRTIDNEGLQTLLAGAVADSRRSGQPLRVVLRADGRQRSGNMNRVLDTCRRMGVRQIVFRARDGQR